MRLGMALPYQQPDGSAPSVTDVMARAKLIEDVGFDGIWLNDTVGRTATTWPDPLMWLLAAAASTRRIELGTAVLQVPLRNTVDLALRLITLHALSGGRFRAGLGAGSTQTDFAAAGVDYSQRFRLFAEALPAIRRLCNGEQVGAANLQPWPSTRGGLPIFIGAWASGIWVLRAARDYDGWIASARTSFKTLAEGIERYRDAGGKRALVATLSVDLSRPEAPLDEDAPLNLLCGPESAAERLQRIVGLGYDDALLVRFGHTEADLTAADLRQIRALIR